MDPSTFDKSRGGTQWRSRFQPLSKHSFEPIRCCLLSLGAGMQTARVHRRFLAARRRRGRSRRARSSPTGCGASACSSASSETIRNVRPVSRHFCRGCSNWAGPMAATCGSTSRWAAGNADRHSQTRSGIGRARARRDPGRWRREPSAQLLQATRTVPIVFVIVPDPVGAGFVDSLSRPGGNATGFMQFEYSLSAKWLELLKEIAPGVKRAAVLRDAAIPPGSASSPSSST